MVVIYKSITDSIYFPEGLFFKLRSSSFSKIKFFSSLRCIFYGKLEGEKNLPVSYYGYIFPLRGGGKKRKKKNYTKPKKIKHVRKKTKLKVLNYYSVSENSVLRLRKESPESPGCFMANHNDRITCGKTSITFVRTSFI